jgi:ABC-type dipeptide/oligopeptide/nickel transport system permease subunit
VVFLAPMNLVAPGVALFAVIAGLTLLGDGLRATMGLALPEARLADDTMAGEGA